MKNYFDEQRKYLSNNPNKYWFKAKLYGWGWTPATWQGWAILGLFVAVAAGNFMRIDAAQHSASDTLVNFVPQTFVLVLVLIGICLLTGERPRWQWGPPKE